MDNYKYETIEEITRLPQWQKADDFFKNKSSLTAKELNEIFSWLYEQFNTCKEFMENKDKYLDSNFGGTKQDDNRK